MLVKPRVRANILVMTMVMMATIIPAVFFAPQAFAQTSKAANVLKVSPVRSDIEIPAGTSKKVSVTISNLTKAPITVRPIENDFIAGDERGTPALILDETKYAPTHSLKRFMTPLVDVTIPAEQSKTIDVVITVPKTAQAGGYFGAIRFAPTSPDSGGQVNLSASVASIILMTVPGDAVENLQLTDFEIQQDGKKSTYFQTPDNLQAAIRFLNKGNIQLAPFGKLSVKQGDKVVYETDFNLEEPRNMVLPDSARRWEIPLEKIGTFGQYTVVATFTYGKKNQTIEVIESFWVIPQSIIIAAIAGLLVLIGLIVGIWLFLRNYKRRILRNHGGRGSGGLRRR